MKANFVVLNTLILAVVLINEGLKSRWLQNGD